jgi:hypothetical protein
VTAPAATSACDDALYRTGVFAQQLADTALDGGEPGVRALADDAAQALVAVAAHRAIADKHQDRALDYIDTWPGMFA